MKGKNILTQEEEVKNNYLHTQERSQGSSDTEVS